MTDATDPIRPAKEKHMTKPVTPTKIEIDGQDQYDLWLATKPDFFRITHFLAKNLPLVTALPDMPAVTYFWAYNLPLVTALPDMPAVTEFCAKNLPLVSALPDMPAVTEFCADKFLLKLRK